MLLYRLAVFLGQLGMGSNADLISFMQGAGVNAYPNEACGFVVVTDAKRPMFIECENVAEDPSCNFMILPSEYVRASKLGKVSAVWHTHVDMAPSASQPDIVGCEATGTPWFIMSVYKSGGDYCFSPLEKVEPSGYQAPYLSRPYVEGCFDCYSLVRDYYFREYKVTLRDYPRFEDDGSRGRKKFSERWENEGFILLVDQEPTEGDVFLVQVNTETPEHIAVYVGDDKILHHCHGRLSRHDIYSGFWKFHTTHHLRHRTKC